MTGVLRPFQKLAVVYYHVRMKFLNLIIHSCSYFKQYVIYIIASIYPEVIVGHNGLRSNSRAYLCIIYEKTKWQIPLRPSLGKHNIQAKEVYYVFTS